MDFTRVYSFFGNETRHTEPGKSFHPAIIGSFAFNGSKPCFKYAIAARPLKKQKQQQQKSKHFFLAALNVSQMLLCWVALR